MKTFVVITILMLVAGTACAVDTCATRYYECHCYKMRLTEIQDFTQEFYVNNDNATLASYQTALRTVYDMAFGEGGYASTASTWLPSRTWLLSIAGVVVSILQPYY